MHFSCQNYRFISNISPRFLTFHGGNLKIGWLFFFKLHFISPLRNRFLGIESCSENLGSCLLTWSRWDSCRASTISTWPTPIPEFHKKRLSLRVKHFFYQIFIFILVLLPFSNLYVAAKKIIHKVCSGIFAVFII